MEWKQIESDWSKLKSDAKSRWGKLTEADLNSVGGRRDDLVGKVQQHYSLSKDNATKQVTEWGASAKLPGGDTKVPPPPKKK